MSEKRCAKCNTLKPADREHFHRSKEGKFGLHAYCRVCMSAYNRAANAEYTRIRMIA